MLEVSYERRNTREVRIGSVTIGGNNLIAVQSMITEETANIPAAARQIIELHKAGSEIVRVTTPTLQDAEHLREIKDLVIKDYCPVPLVADVHHNGTNIAVEAAKHVDKVRINPGLYVHHKKVERQEDYTQNEVDEQREEIETALTPIIRVCQDRGVAMRIGVNHGSLAERLMVMYGDTPQGMVESALEYINICEAYDFKDLIISLKASRVPVMEQANRLMVARMDELGMDYPIHLGVTETGKDQYARVKSAVGIGTLLSEGIGDTIRVSLAENPVDELSVCYDILQARGLRKTKAELIGCPGCGRTKFDLPTVMDRVFQATSHLKDSTIAVMGCVVNGPGEMADADYGYVGLGGGKVMLYRGRQVITAVPQEEALSALIGIIKQDGKWFDPPTDVSNSELEGLNPRIAF